MLIGSSFASGELLEVLTDPMGKRSMFRQLGDYSSLTSCQESAAECFEENMNYNITGTCDTVDAEVKTYYQCFNVRCKLHLCDDLKDYAAKEDSCDLEFKCWLTTGAFAGLIVGVGVFLFIVIGVIVFFVLRRRRNSDSAVSNPKTMPEL